MATSQKQKALGIARLLAVAGIVLVGALLTVPRGPAQPGQTPSPGQVSKALRLAIEFHKNRDFAQASGYFDIARDGQQSLSPAEQKELATFGGYNALALKSQQEGATQIRQLEEAVQQGRARTRRVAQRAQLSRNLSPRIADTDRAEQACRRKPPRPVRSRAGVGLQVDARRGPRPFASGRSQQPTPMRLSGEGELARSAWLPRSNSPAKLRATFRWPRRAAESATPREGRSTHWISISTVRQRQERQQRRSRRSRDGTPDGPRRFYVPRT